MFRRQYTVLLGFVPHPNLRAQGSNGAVIIHRRPGHDFHLQGKIFCWKIIIDTEAPQMGHIPGPGQNPGSVRGKLGPQNRSIMIYSGYLGAILRPP